MADWFYNLNPSKFETYKGTLPEATLFIHGNFASNRWWYPSLELLCRQADGTEALRQQADGTEALLAELPGCGKSAALNGVEDYQMSKIAKNFNQELATMDLGPINIVGHSTGGLVAALMLAEQPRLFKKALLLDPAGACGVPVHRDVSETYARMADDKKVTAAVMNNVIYKNDPQSKFFKEVIVEDAHRAAQKVGDKLVRNLVGIDFRAQIAQIENEVLILHGDQDVLLPVQGSEDMAALIKNARFELVPNQGHCTNVENPHKFAEILSRFFSYT